MKPSTWRYILFLVALAAVAAALLPYLSLSLPNPAGLDGSPATQRAVRQIASLSTSTRTPGAPNHDAARDALAAELRGLGLEVEIQRSVVDGLAAPLLALDAGGGHAA